MSEIWIANASPIITLSKTRHLHLLTDLSTELLVPDAVARELLAGAPDDPARQSLEGGFGQSATVDQIPKKILEWGLGSGESAVLAVAMEIGNAVAVLDDATARKCAHTLSVSVIGTLGVVVRAKVRGLIQSASDVIRALRAAGLYLDDKTIQEALEGATGERWNG